MRVSGASPLRLGALIFQLRGRHDPKDLETEVKPKISTETSGARSFGMAASAVVTCDHCGKKGQNRASL